MIRSATLLTTYYLRLLLLTPDSLRITLTRLVDSFRDALVYKLFAFQCINCYNQLFYTAFVRSKGIELFGKSLVLKR